LESLCVANQFGMVGGGDALAVDADGGRGERVGVRVHRGFGVIRAGRTVPLSLRLAAAGGTAAGLGRVWCSRLILLPGADPVRLDSTGSMLVGSDTAVGFVVISRRYLAR
jgi:hypothetical protein